MTNTYRPHPSLADKLNPECNGCCHKNYLSCNGVTAICDYADHYYPHTRCASNGVFHHYGKDACPYKETYEEYLVNRKRLGIKAAYGGDDTPRPMPQRKRDYSKRTHKPYAKYYANVRGDEMTGTIYQIASHYGVSVKTARTWANPKRTPHDVIVTKLADYEGGDPHDGTGN